MNGHTIQPDHQASPPLYDLQQLFIVYKQGMQ